MATVYLGIGSNIGDKKANCDEALQRLQDTEGISLSARSTLYSTQPVGGPLQEEYLNGALEIKTEIPPEELLAVLKNIEQEMGRESLDRNYPRIIDIDILFYDNVTVSSNNLTIPHPRMHERYFVLRGLNEIAPDVLHPVFGESVAELYERVEKI